MGPYAVAGVGAGAWPAALFAAGVDRAGMERACRQQEKMGMRMLGVCARGRALAQGSTQAVFPAQRLSHLLDAQTGRRVLALCPGKTIFPLRLARTGQSFLFSTQGFAQESGVMLVTQASVSFAARAEMGLPPLLEPMDWMGSPLLPYLDTGFAARQLLAMGAQRVLIADVRPSSNRTLDALELAYLACSPQECFARQPGTAVLRIVLPDSVHALDARGTMRCVEAGKKAAERELDRLFETMGMAFCRVLPFSAPRAHLQRL